MKIFLISTNADEAGAPRHVETIVHGLEAKFQFVLVFGEEGPVSTRLKERGHIVYIINEMGTAISPIKDLIALVSITRLIRRHKPDIVHCHSAKAGMLGRLAAFFNGNKWLYTVHGWGWRGAGRITQLLVISIEKLLSTLPRGYYIFVANDVMNEAKRVLGIKGSKGCVVYNGVPPFPIDTQEAAQDLVIMMPARVSSAKDHQCLISAFEQLADDSAKLILCGGGTDSPEFIDLAKELAPKTNGNIIFLGQRSDMADIYAQSNVVALISHFEALPLSIIEAMSCAKPVVATDVGGISELITNGVNGILVKRSCTDDIVAAFKELRDEDVRARIGVKAKSSYHERFTEDFMVDSISKIYHTL
jgi:glycosyltransferase involved in cell wall biosynthesis